MGGRKGDSIFYQHLVGSLNWKLPKNESFTAASSLYGAAVFAELWLRRVESEKYVLGDISPYDCSGQVPFTYPTCRLRE